jgi:hypothetical protein
VGEGQTSRRGLLRFVLEGDGCQVLAEAATSAELARELAVHRPDVIVLDDGIGATAVGMAKEMVPTAKVVLVWPRAVVPIGGDAQVDPGEVLSDLGPTVNRLAGAAALGLTTVSRPSWMDRNRKDTSTLRDMLNKADPERDRPNVTELQRRGQRLHPAAPVPPIPVGPTAPTDAQATEAEPVIQDRGTEPLVILPTTGGDASNPTTTPEDETDDRSGAAAVAGAAVAGAAGLSLAEQLAAGKAAEEATARAAAEAAERGTAESGPVGAADGDEVDSDAPERGGKVVPLAAAAAAAGAATVASVAGATPAAAAEVAGTAAGAAGATSQVAAGAAGAAGVAAKSKLLGSIALGGAAAAGALVLAISLGGSRVPTDIGAAPTEPPTDGSGGAVIWPGTDGTPGSGSHQGPGQGPGKGPGASGPADQGGGNEVPSDAFYPPVPSGADGGGGVSAQGSGAGGSGTTTAAAGAAAAGGASGGGGVNDPATPSAHTHPEHPLGGPPGQTGAAPGHGGESPPGSQLQSTGAKGRGSGTHRGSRSGRGTERPAHHHKR